MALGQHYCSSRSVAAQVAGVFPHRHGLAAQSHAVQRSVVTILAGDWNALDALGSQRSHHTTGGTVVGGDHGVNLAAGLGDDLFHVLLGNFGLPAVGVFLAHDLDVALFHSGINDFLLATAQEVGIGVSRRALDHHVVALGLGFQNGAGLHAAHFHVVEGDVEHAGRFDQAVIGDHGDLLLVGLVHGGQDGVLVHGQDDQGLGAFGDQAVDVRQLLLGGTASVSADVGGAVFGQLGLDSGFVGFPALFLEVGPAHAHHLGKGASGSQAQGQGGQCCLQFHQCLR